MSSSPRSSTSTIDTHVHVWDVSGGPYGVRYPWLGPHLPALYRTFTIDDIRADFVAQGIDGIVLVQAADSLAETHELLAVAARCGIDARVTGWLPLADPGATAVALQQFRPAGPKDPSPLVGVRHLIHDEPDTQWMLRNDVAQGMELIAAGGLLFEAVAERAELIAQIPLVAQRHPQMTIVLDHLGKPPIADGGWQPWADLVAAAAEHPTVFAKISGLGTASQRGWTSDDWRRYVEFAIDTFGPHRLMLGGDWPVALLAGSYADTWAATLAVIDALTHDEQQLIRRDTAAALYRF